MKTLSAFAAALLTLSPLLAEDQNAAGPLPGEEPQGMLEKPVTLMPEAVPRAASGKKGATAKNATNTNVVQNEADLRAHIRFREVKTQVLQNADVQEALAHAEAAPTIPGKRDALRVYYKLLYARILKIDGSLKTYVEKVKQFETTQLTQARLNGDTPVQDAAQSQ